MNVKVTEGERTRVQAYEGVCIARAGGGMNESFTVRKFSYGEGVERVFPVLSPNIESIKLVRRGKVRRAKLDHLRDRRGKSARIAEKMETPAAKAAREVAKKATKARRQDKEGNARRRIGGQAAAKGAFGIPLIYRCFSGLLNKRPSRHLRSTAPTLLCC